MHDRATLYEINLYKNYINRHASLVDSIWYQDLLPKLCMHESILSNEIISEINERIARHDQDKVNDPEILHPYARYFNTRSKAIKESIAYRKAWLKHQKMNPHHWQYWVVLNDETIPSIDALPMDISSICEMLCDWQAASLYYGRTARLWYEEQGNSMILHTDTRRIVERLLCYLDQEKTI